MSARLRQVIEVEEVRGRGTEDQPFKTVIVFYSKDGKMLGHGIGASIDQAKEDIEWALRDIPIRKPSGAPQTGSEAEPHPKSPEASIEAKRLRECRGGMEGPKAPPSTAHVYYGLDRKPQGDPPAPSSSQPGPFTGKKLFGLLETYIPGGEDLRDTWFTDLALHHGDDMCHALLQLQARIVTAARPAIGG